MASVRVETRLFWPFAAMAFIVVSFHWAISLAAVCDEARTAVRQKKKPGIGFDSARPIAGFVFCLTAVLDSAQPADNEVGQWNAATVEGSDAHGQPRLIANRR